MHIKNIALIEEIDIDFHEQLNILTGETGAGKSIIIGSLGICLGGKFPKELLRDDTKDGLVELVFSVDQPAIVEALEKLEVTPDEDGTLLISRRLSPNGRTVNRVNDTTVTITRLKEIASLLIDLHAQHEQQTLLKPAKHLEILDRFGGEDIQKLKKQVQEDYHTYRELEEEKKKGSMDEAEKNKRMDFLQYQIKEIKDAKLVDGEDVQLERQYKKAVNAKEILQYANDIYALTGYGATSAGEQLGRAIKDMRRLTELDHQEQDAVVLGYGLYREISAEIFSVEMIQALLYQTGKEKKETTEQEGKERPREENPPVQMEETLWGEQEAEAAENFFVEAEEEKDEGRWKNIVEAVICIGFLGGVLALRWTQAETVWYLVLGGAAAVVGIVSLALELASRWKKRQSGTETGSYGKAAGIRKQGETGDVFSEYQNRKGLNSQKMGTKK